MEQDEKWYGATTTLEISNPSPELQQQQYDQEQINTITHLSR